MGKYYFKSAGGMLSFLLVLAMVFGLAACSPGTKGKTTDSGSNSGNEPKLAKTYEKATEGGYPVVKEPLTFKYWRPMNASAAQYIASYAENEAYQEMEKKTGIHIEFTHPAQNQENEQFNLMIASNDLPDVISGAARYKGGLSKGVDDGVFLDLDPYIKKYAPDYNKIVRSDVTIFRQAAFDDGRVSAFYQLKPKEQEDPPFHGPVIKKDWLDELGLQVPKTIDDWYMMLKAFKEKKKASAPLIIPAAGIDPTAGTFLTAFDLAPGDFYLRDGKVVDSPKIQPRFKDYLALMNKWYNEGLITKDFAALKNAQHRSLFSSDQSGAHYVLAVGDTVIMCEPLNIKITIAPMPRLKATDTIHFRYPAWPVTGEETVVTASCKYPVEAVRWLNYAYTQEGATLVNYGVEGKSWVKGPDGKPQFTDYILKNPKFNATAASYILKVHFMPKLTFSDMIAHPNMISSPQAAALRKEWGKETNRDEILAVPPVRLTVEESNKRAQIMTDVNAYMNEMILKFITGSEPLSRYDDYVKQVKALNIDEAIKITQRAYDTYMKINIK